MRKRKAIVVSFSVPKVSHSIGTYIAKVIFPVTNGYATDDDGQTWYQYKRRVALTGRKEVFLNFRPQIGQTIEV